MSDVRVRSDSPAQQCSVADFSVLIEHEANGPDFFWLQRSFRTELASGVPCRACVDWVERRMSHDRSPWPGLAEGKTNEKA